VCKQKPIYIILSEPGILDGSLAPFQGKSRSALLRIFTGKFGHANPNDGTFISQAQMHHLLYRLESSLHFKERSAVFFHIPTPLAGRSIERPATYRLITPCAI
jgi:hypothetical protein